MDAALAAVSTSWVRDIIVDGPANGALKNKLILSPLSRTSMPPNTLRVTSAIKYYFKDKLSVCVILKNSSSAIKRLLQMQLSNIGPNMLWNSSYNRF